MVHRVVSSTVGDPSRIGALMEPLMASATHSLTVAAAVAAAVAVAVGTK